MLNKDYREMFPRATKGIDFFVWATPENATNLLRALMGMTPRTGYAPLRPHADRVLRRGII
jgi:hypothetical protein